MKRFFSVFLAALCIISLAGTAGAAQVDCDEVYCFSVEDFSTQEDTLVGICITGLPESSTGTVFLHNRVLQKGDILPADQLQNMTFTPLRSEQNRDAVVTFLPIYENRVASQATMTLSVRGKKDLPPVAEDFAMETYKNLPNQGKLKVYDPEGKELTYTITRKPRRGTVEVQEDGSFQYTPKKNKVGADSFTYTAVDPSGNVSREATVTVQILKPADASQYTDTVGRDCRFAAEWMRNTGLFVSEKIGDENCFYPDKPVSKGEFLALVTRLLEIPLQTQNLDSELTQNAPQWLKPYLAAALRSGLVTNTQSAQTGEFAAEDAMTGGEAAVILQNALDLAVQTDGMLVQPDEEVTTPTWTETALAAMNQNGIVLEEDAAMTRGTLANVLYQVSRLAPEAPGMMVLRMQQ